MCLAYPARVLSTVDNTASSPASRCPHRCEEAAALTRLLDLEQEVS